MGKLKGSLGREFTLIEGEEWRPIAGFEEMYEISNLGRVLSLHFRTRNNKLVLKGYDRGGYRRVCLMMDGKRCFFSVHRLVAMAFIPNPENKPCINHEDGVRDNNRIENLTWVTNSENTLHAWRIGLKKRLYGKDHHNFGRIVSEAQRQKHINNPSSSRQVINTDTGIIYKSIREAADIEGLDYAQVRRSLVRESGYGFKLSYYSVKPDAYKPRKSREAVNV